MTPDECSIIERMLVGYWPSPAILPEELAVWEKSLRQQEYHQAAQVIETLGESGLKWRPNVGEFILAYRQRTAQRPPPRAQLSEPVSRRPLAQAWRKYLRLQLEGVFGDGEAGVAHDADEMFTRLAEYEATEALLEATEPAPGRLDYRKVI